MSAQQQVAKTSRSELHQQFVSDVFHALSQPLTALRCSLELALIQRGDVQAYRAALEEALRQAERVSTCAEFLRVMAEAEDPGAIAECDLAGCVASVAEEFLPVFESSGTTISASADDTVRVFADQQKLERAIFLALDYGAACGGDVVIHVEAPARLDICYGARALRQDQDDGERPGQSLKLAQKMFVATGAEVMMRQARDEEVMEVVW